MAQNKIFIGNLPFKVSEDQLRDHFTQFGEIVSVAIPKDRESGRPRGFAFVEFNSDESAQGALSLNGTDLDGRNIVVNVAQEKKSGGGRGGNSGGRW